VQKIDTPAGWLAFDPDGKTLLTARHHPTSPDESRVVTRWDLKTFEGKPLPPLGDRGGWAVFHLSPDGKTLFHHMNTGRESDRRIRAYEPATGKELFPRQGHAESSHVCAVAFSPDGERLASVNYDPGVWLWDAATGKPERMLTNEQGFWSVAFS